jgi:hypothetical protein
VLQDLRKFLLRGNVIDLAVAVIIGIAFGCDKTRPDTKNPTDEQAGAGADGNNSAPDSLSNGGPDPETTPTDQPSTPAPDAAPSDPAR